MKILHTADVHLQEDDPTTIAALEAVLATAAEHDVDLLTIGGDLFDTPSDAAALRPRLRDLFQDNPFDIVAIPGNHDEDVYRENLRFGADLEVLTDTPYSSREVGDVELRGAPFTASMDENLFTALQSNATDTTQILLLHCTLDIGFHSDAAGESEGEYFPVTKATLAELGYDYVLAGHIHSTDRTVPLDNGGVFIYPGSPVSHSTGETGRRRAVLIDTDNADVTSIPLDTFYHDSLTKMVRPGEEDALLADVGDWVDRRADDTCELTVEVEGFIDRDEDAFYDQLQAAAAPVDPNDATRSVSHVLDHPLYGRFEEKLNQRADVENPEQVETRVIEVLSELLHQNMVQSP